MTFRKAVSEALSEPLPDDFQALLDKLDDKGRQPRGESEARRPSSVSAQSAPSR